MKQKLNIFFSSKLNIAFTIELLMLIASQILLLHTTYEYGPNPMFGVQMPYNVLALLVNIFAMSFNYNRVKQMQKETDAPKLNEFNKDEPGELDK